MNGSLSWYDTYQYYMSIGDKRVENWPLMATPWPTLGFIVLYGVALVVIKKVMANRPPYKLRDFLVVYNFLQVCGSFYIFTEVSAQRLSRQGESV